MKLYYLILCLMLCTFGALAQEPEDSLSTPEGDDDEELIKPVMNEQVKWGIKLGTGATILIGKEDNNPRPALYLTGGLYNRYLFKPHWAIQTELNIALKGSNFNNGNGEYTAIRTYYAEVPILLIRGLNELNTKNIVVGIQYSRLVNALLYLKDQSFPEEQKPSMNKDDVSLVGGAQFHTPFVGFQLFLKYGLLDTNQGLVSGILPTNTGKSMHNFTFEIALIF